MTSRKGFLLIDLMVALSLFMVLVYAVGHTQATIMLMHHEIMARTDMIYSLRRAIEGKGPGVELLQDKRALNKALPLHTITITTKRAQAHCNLKTVGWVYE